MKTSYSSLSLVQPVGPLTWWAVRVRTACLAAISFFLLSVVTLNVQAQSADVQPPIIEHEEVGSGLAGEMQTFTATITDDQQLVSAVLFHRLAGDDNYFSTEMMPVTGTTVYTASVAITTDDPRDIEYYIQAEDFGGNKALQGFAFDPLIREITADALVVGTLAPTPAPTTSRNRKLLWGALGIVVVALLATQLGSDSDDGDDPPDTTEVPIDIEVNPIGGFGFSF